MRRACECVRPIRRPRERYMWYMVALVSIKNFVGYVFYLNKVTFHTRASTLG